MSYRIWQAWLPDEIAQGLQIEEPKQFAALSSCFCSAVQRALQDEVDHNRWQRLVKWLNYINTFSSLQHDYPAEHVVPMAEALWQAVAESWLDLEAQVRLAESLTNMLRSNKRTLWKARVVLPWRPLFSVFQRLHGLPLPKFEGVGLIMTRAKVLGKLVSKARRYFEPTALGEVWAELRPAVLAVDRRPSEGYEALGYLQLFAPTHNLCSCDWAALNGLLCEWLAAWDGVANSPPWDGMWLGLLSRAAKHDWQGVLRWQAHLPHIFATITGLFDVPIGNSRAAGEFVVRPAPGRAAILFAEQMGFGPFYSARLVIHLLKSTADPQRGPSTAASAVAAVVQVEHLTALLEQYYHPSNTGKWCRELGTFLKHMVKAAVKQLERQHPPPPQSAVNGVAAGPTTDEYDFDFMQGGGVEGGAGPVERAARHGVSELREAELQRLAACCVTLAARGQFSKDQNISNVSIKALSQLALVSPQRVLPLVLERFRTAIATATATHQLVAATATLALCVRPLLLAGWAVGGEGEERETAVQLISEALMAGLPGLDANDESKTNAILHLYVSVISALPRLRGAGEEENDDDVAACDEEEEHTFGRVVPTDTATVTTLPMDVDSSGGGGNGGGNGGGQDKGLTLSLYVAEWAEEVLERCLALLQNLDSGPGHRGTDMASRGGGDSASTSSFLADPRSLFGPLWQLLLHHSRPSVRRHLVQRLAAFLLGSATPGVAKEMATLASHATSSAPRAALRSFVLPLLARIEAEVEELRPVAGSLAPGAVPPPPSASRECTLRYHLIITMESINQLHADIIMTPNIHMLLGLPALAPHIIGGGEEAATQQQPFLELPPGSLIARVVSMADRLMAVNSSVLQEKAATAVAVVLNTLPRHWLDPHLPWRRPKGQVGTGGAPLVPGRGVELWVDKFGTGYRRPRWLRPRPGHVEIANQLLRQRLVGTAEQLKAMLAAPGSSAGGGGVWGGDACGKLLMRARLLQIRAVILNSMSMLRDFNFGAGANGDSSGGDGGVSLAVSGRLGDTMGHSGDRERVADVLVLVCSALRNSADPELLSLAAGCGTTLLAAGSVGYVTAQTDEKHQRASAHLYVDPPAAARLMEPGTVWRRRSSMWVVQARLFNTLMSRSSAAAFRSWATTTRPELTRLDEFPTAFLSLLRTLCQLAQHPNAVLGRKAASAVEVATKRFPCLAPIYLPYFLGAIAGVPYDWTPSANDPEPVLEEFFRRIREAAFSSGSEAGAVSETSRPSEPPLSESERDGKVLGSCHTLNSTLAFWRLISRSPAWMGAALGAILAGRIHNSSVPQKALGELLLSFAGRFLHPPAMSYSDNGDNSYGQLVRSLVAIAKPGAMARRGAPFRYTIIANAMVMLLLPHRYGTHLPPASSAPQPAAAGISGGGALSEYGGQGGANLEVAGLLLRHMLGLLVGADAPQLRQLSMGGTFLPLCAVEEYGAPLPQLIDVLREAIADAAAADAGPGWGARLLHTLVHSHTELDTAEAMKDKRGASMLALQQRIMNMTFEEMAAGLASLPLDRLARWPNDGLSAPEAVADGSFVVRHARLVQLLAAAAPAEMLAALRAPLEALTSIERLTAAGNGSDKTEMAAVAETLAGLLGSGAPWSPAATAAVSIGVTTSAGAAGIMEEAVVDGGGGWVVAALGRAIRATSLDMVDSWAVSCRYALRGLLDGLFPERLHPAAPPAPDRAPMPRPPLAAGLTRDALAAAVGDLLSIVMGPSSLGLSSLPRTSAVAPETDVKLPNGSGGGTFYARMKRIRCLGAVIRELAGLDASRELPAQVRRFWAELLDELHAATSSLDSLSLRELLRSLITETLAFFGATEGLLQVMRQQQQPSGGSYGGSGNGNFGKGVNGSNGEGDLIHVSAEPSGISTPTEVEVELGAGGSGEEDRAVMLMLPNRPQQHNYHESLSHMRRRAFNLALTLAWRFNQAAAHVQEVRAAEAAVAAVATMVPTTSPPTAAATPNPRDSAGGTSGSGATDDVVLVDVGDVVSASASEHTSPCDAAPVGGPMDIDITSTTGAGGGSGDDGGAAFATAMAIANLGLGQEVILDAAARIRSPGLREVVVGLLPGLLRLQDVAGPELQKLSRGFQATLLVVRCVGLNTHGGATIPYGTSSAANPDAGASAGDGGFAAKGGVAGSGAMMLASAVDALCAASVVDVPWSARAAALSYAQTFWFRHAPLLSRDQLRRVQAVVEARLVDSKAEVRFLAAATLSGLLRGTAQEDVEVLRNRLLDQADALLGATSCRRRSVDKSAVTTSVHPQLLQLQKLGCIAGLSALLMSNPYDVPAWLPPVLMALVRAAGGGERDGTVRSEAGRALGEFRRTHEAEALEDLRGRMDPDDWDRFTQATGAASYFV